MENKELKLRIKLHGKKKELKRYKELTGVLQRKLYTSENWEVEYLRIAKEFNEYKAHAQDKIQELLQRLKPFEAKQDEN